MLMAFVPDLVASFAGSFSAELASYPFWLVANRLLLQGTGLIVTGVWVCGCVFVCASNLRALWVWVWWLGAPLCVRLVCLCMCAFGLVRGASARVGECVGAQRYV